ncbi:polymorphic mucin-like protein [Schistosoma japonicum]|nr:polymorphic mucin-like protein [Schistosoma japonicum]
MKPTKIYCVYMKISLKEQLMRIEPHRQQSTILSGIGFSRTKASYHVEVTFVRICRFQTVKSFCQLLDSLCVAYSPIQSVETILTVSRIVLMHWCQFRITFGTFYTKTLNELEENLLNTEAEVSSKLHDKLDDPFHSLLKGRTIHLHFNKIKKIKELEAKAVKAANEYRRNSNNKEFLDEYNKSGQKLNGALCNYILVFSYKCCRHLIAMRRQNKFSLNTWINACFFN